jgi:hypothetical protein
MAVLKVPPNVREMLTHIFSRFPEMEKTLARLAHKVDTFRGDGLRNMPDVMSLSIPNVRPGSSVPQAGGNLPTGQYQDMMYGMAGDNQTAFFYDRATA